MEEEKVWYYAKRGKPFGPMTELEICRSFEKGEFTPEEFVFCKGQMKEWVKAGTVPGLCDSLELSPEPEPEHHEVPAHEKASFVHEIGKENLKLDAERRRREELARRKRLDQEREKREKEYWSKLKKKN